MQPYASLFVFLESTLVFVLPVLRSTNLLSLLSRISPNRPCRFRRQIYHHLCPTHLARQEFAFLCSWYPPSRSSFYSTNLATNLPRVSTHINFRPPSTLARSSSRSPPCFRFTFGHSLHLYSLSLNPTQPCNSPSHILAIKAFEVLVDELTYRNRLENVFRSSSQLQLQGLVSISCLISRLESESVAVIDAISAVYILSSSQSIRTCYIRRVRAPEVG